MSEYRAKDLLLVPGLLTLARVPLAAAFPFAVSDARLGLVVLALAGATDVLDGWYARRFNQVTPIGAVVDGITDKLFILSVVVTLIVTERLRFDAVTPPSVPLAVLLFSTREVGELPLIAWFAMSSHKRIGRPENWAANMPGKVATALQFACVVSAMFGWPETDPLLVATAAVGVASAALYWRRTISTIRNARHP